MSWEEDFPEDELLIDRLSQHSTPGFGDSIDGNGDDDPATTDDEVEDFELDDNKKKEEKAGKEETKKEESRLQGNDDNSNIESKETKKKSQIASSSSSPKSVVKETVQIDDGEEKSSSEENNPKSKLTPTEKEEEEEEELSKRKTDNNAEEESSTKSSASSGTENKQQQQRPQKLGELKLVNNKQNSLISSADLIKEQTERLGDEMEHLLEDIRRVGEPGKPEVLFGELFDDPEVEQYYEALVGTLKGAKKRGLINFKGQMLLKGPHDKVLITIVNSQ